MNRRELLTSLGVGTVTALAGCMGGNSDAEPMGGEESTSYDDLSEEKQEELLNEELDEVYNQRVEDGSLIKGHNLDVASVDTITDNSVTIETTISLNPIEDYNITVHYNPVTANDNGEWVFKNSTDPVYGQDAEYDSETDTWIPSNQDATKTLQYDFKNTEVGEHVSSLTVPSEAYWNEDVTVGEERINNRAFYRQDIYSHGWGRVNEFSLESPPEMYETFVYTLTWEDENTDSPRGGEVIANTAPMLRVGEDDYIYPRTHNGNFIINPNWDSKGFIRNDNRDYKMSDIYRDNIDKSGDSFDAHITRLSNYGRFSPRIRNEFADANSVKVASAQGPEYFDAHLQYPWTVSYEIDRSTFEEAQKTAASYKVGGKQTNDVKALVNAPEVMNHDVVQEVASKLGDVCEMMNATHPSEQLRVVADFVQYFSHTSEDALPFGRPSNLLPGTAHPVATLARGLGDCKDYTVLGNAILQQEPFNMNLDVICIPEVYQYIAEEGDVNAVGHVTTAVPSSELGLDELSIDNVGEPLGGTLGTLDIDGVEHSYIEMSGPFDVGFVSSQWMDFSELVHIDNV